MTARVRMSRRGVLAAVGVAGFALAVILAAAGLWLPAAVAIYLPSWAIGQWDGIRIGLDVGAAERVRLLADVNLLRTQVAGLEDERDSGYATWDARRWAGPRPDWAAANEQAPAARAAESSRVASST